MIHKTVKKDLSMNDLRAQLSPGWSPVNIGLTVILLFIFWPLAALMVAYVIWGKRLGLDLSKPGSVGAFGGRLKRAWRAAKAAFGDADTHSSTTLAGGTPDVGTTSTVGVGTPLDGDRAALQREKAALDAEKREGAPSRSDVKDAVDS